MRMRMVLRTAQEQAALFSPALVDHRGVRAAEAEGVLHGVVDLHPAGLVGAAVDVAFGILLEDVDRRGRDLLLERLDRRRRREGGPSWTSWS